jgi:hypothetical protein
MRLVAAVTDYPSAESEIETVTLSPAQIEFLDRLSRELDPDIAPAFGRPHVVRALLEKLEEAEVRNNARRR